MAEGDFHLAAFCFHLCLSMLVTILALYCPTLGYLLLCNKLLQTLIAKKQETFNFISLFCESGIWIGLSYMILHMSLAEIPSWYSADGRTTVEFPR